MRSIQQCALLAAVVAASAAFAQDKPESKPVTVDGKVQVGVHRFDVDPPKLYRVRIEVTGFQPNVNLSPSRFANTTKENDGDTFIGIFMPGSARPHRVVIVPSLWDEIGDGPMNFKLTIEPIAIAKQPVLEQNDELKTSDAPYKNESGYDGKSPTKIYPIKLQGRKIYIIEVKKKANFDPAVLLEGPNGQIVASDDDGGGEGNARLVFAVRREGQYRLVVTTGDPPQRSRRIHADGPRHRVSHPQGAKRATLSARLSVHAPQ